MTESGRAKDDDNRSTTPCRALVPVGLAPSPVTLRAAFVVQVVAAATGPDRTAPYVQHPARPSARLVDLRV